MGVIAIVYTVMGGIKAVIYTDTIQWMILMGGLIFIGLPMSYYAIGGYEGMINTIRPELLYLTNINWSTLVNWSVTIIPIWFVGMTLYQRIYACGNEKVAKKAWFIAGLFEWPVMAFMGVLLGLFARVAADQGMFAELGYLDPANMDAEIGLPLLLRSILPVGLMGLMMSAYFSAIMSTADSCLMAASGNLQTDVLGRWLHSGKEEKSILRNSQVLTLVVGIIALVLAAFMQNVLTLMLYSYAFMVSGLFVPVLGALFMDKPSSLAAFLAMLLGGGVTLTLILTGFALPFELDANIFGITTALATFIIVNYIKGRIAIKTAVS
jgi:SSS family solute:Na+ symporter